MKKEICIFLLLFGILMFFNLDNICAYEEYSVTDFGAYGYDDKDDTIAFQNCLDKAKGSSKNVSIDVPAGKYYINDTLIIYSNTSLHLDDNAEIIRTNQNKYLLINDTSNNKQGVGGYDQSQNIVIDGGIWNGNGNSNEYIMLMNITHARNIILKNTFIKNVCHRHMVAFSAIDGLEVFNNTFFNMIEYTGENLGQYYVKKDNEGNYDKISSYKYMEALHIDCVSKDGHSEPNSKPYDGTSCQNIKLYNNTFRKVKSGIGSHYDASESIGLNYKIYDNYFENIDGVCINLFNINGVEINNNKGTSRQFIKGKNVKGIIEKNNINIHDNNKNYQGIEITANSQLDIINNKIDSAANNGIYVIDSLIENVTGNIITSTDGNGIKIINSNIKNGADNIISNSSKDGINISKSSQISLSNNTILNSNTNAIKVNNSNCELDDNIIKKSEIGLLIEDIKKSNIDIKNNNIIDATNCGLKVKNSIIDKISKNLIKNTQYGIYLSKSSLKIDSNIIQNSSYGILLDNNSESSIIKNEINDSTMNSIKLNNSYGCIKENKSAESKGISVYILKCNNSSKVIDVSGNIINNSKNDGIRIKDSKKINIFSNKVYDCKGNGITSLQSNTVKISKNDIFNNKKYGISINNSKNVNVEQNTSKFNGLYDIYCHTNSTGKANNNTISSSSLKTYNKKKFPFYNTKIYNNMQTFTYNIKDKIYSGKAIKINLSNIIVKHKGKLLKINKNYTITKVKYTTNNEVGTAKISFTITGKGQYSGCLKKVLQFKILPKKEKITKIKKNKNKIELSWEKQPNVSGYKFYYRLSTSKRWKCKTLKKNSLVLSSLKKKKKYHVKVRAYKKYGKTVKYGQYSATKQVSLK